VIEIGGAVYYTGDFPEGILVLLRDAIANADFSGIAGLIGISGVTVQDNNGNEYGPQAQPVSAPTADVSAIGDPVVPTRESRSTMSAGGYVGLAVAGLVVGMVILFASRRGRRSSRSSERAALKHQQIDDNGSEDGSQMQTNMRGIQHNVSTDDESDEAGSRYYETSPDRGERFPKEPIAHVVDESSVWESESRTPQRFRYQRPREEVASEGIGLDEALQGHSCNQPNCILCRAKSDIKFVPTGEPPERPSFPSAVSRGYVADDTVAL
jgi:hypothetical protein